MCENAMKRLYPKQAYGFRKPLQNAEKVSCALHNVIKIIGGPLLIASYEE